MDDLTLPPLPKKYLSLPSITKQTKWRCELVDFGKAASPLVAYFNPSLVRRPDGLWLITRRSIQSGTMAYGFNDIVAFKVGDDWKPQYGQKVGLPQIVMQEHHEDPRAFYRDGKTWISCCTFIMNGENRQWTGAHQAIFPVSNEWQALHRFDPPFEGNTESVYFCKGNEKNWVWFFHGNEPHFVYLSRPHTVVQCNHVMRPVAVFKTGEIEPKWNYGERRGGTPPVLHNGLYWSFFHSSRPSDHFKCRQYFMGVYAFEAAPPFRIVRISEHPFLAGSIEDPWARKKPLVVFPCGAIIENGAWLISLGVNDLTSALISIPHKDLLMRTSFAKEILTDSEV